MTTSPTPAPASPVPPPVSPGTKEIRIISHSTLYYWWPLWFFGIIFAAWTYAEGYRMAIVSKDSKVIVSKAPDGRVIHTIRVEGDTSRLMKEALPKDDKNEEEFILKTRVSPHAWMGPLFCVILLLVVFITNVPLRGLWSLVAIIAIIVLALVLSLFEMWDKLLGALGDLHIYINMAGYMTISVVLLIGWVLAVKIFDNRTYIIFTPGQIKVCEEIGGREKVYDTTGMTVEKQRDDWFRHIILGFGTGDLIVRTAGADRHEIVMPNVAFIGFKIDAVERMLRQRQQQAV